MYDTYKNKTLYQAVLDSKNKYKNRKALYFKGKYISYSTLISRINSFSYTLKELGYKKDDVITICLPNIPEAVYLLYAVNQIGAIANLIHPLMARDQLEGILKKVNSKILFILDTRYNEFKDLKDEGISVYPVSPVKELSPIINFGYKKLNSKDLSYLKEKNENHLNMDKFYKNKEEKEFDKDYLKDAIYLHSGGTTGTPKTIALSSNSLNNLITNAYDVLDYKDGDFAHVLSVLPMFHGFGLAICIHIALVFGGTDMLMPKFSTKETIKLLKKGKLNYIAGVPTLFEALLRNKDFDGEKLKHLKGCYVGGDFVHESLVERFNERMAKNGVSARLYRGYGLTECVTVCAVNTSTNNRDESCGKALYNVNIKVVNENNEEVGPNVDGEIVLNGETLMNGYRFDPTNKIEEGLYITLNGEKYLKTGDYGYLDKDGYIFFKQRIKRLVKVNGINIFPYEIEEIVTSLPYVFEAAAIGVEDEKHGHMIKLFIVLDKNAPKEVGNYTKEINELIVNKVSIYAKPKEIVYVDSLPKTLVGKIDYKELK